MIDIIKVFISAAIIVVAAQVAKKSTFWGALLISMPINSILSLVFLHADTKDSRLTAAYAKDIFILVPISLVFFIPFLFATKTEWPFWINLGVGITFLGIALLLIALFKKIFYS